MKFVVYRGIIYKNRSQKITYRIKLKKLYKCSFSKINIIHVIRNFIILSFKIIMIWNYKKPIHPRIGFFMSGFDSSFQ